MTDYTPSEGFIRAAFIAERSRFKYLAVAEDDAVYEEEFDRWLESVKAEEREQIVRQLENIATNVIKSGNEYWDGYVRALEDVRLNDWPID